ncbi:protein quick-to-court isoform X2 [Centruroides vittatus]|uniref:protein quick-to-court isoform X2 n=1 Tax=Centruroides vittatus TaxID=120091 RepID=UPI00350F2B91
MKRSNSLHQNPTKSNIPKLQCLQRSSSLRLSGESRLSYNSNSSNNSNQIDNHVPQKPQNFPNWKDRIKHYSGDNSRGLTPSEPTTPDVDDKSSVKSFGSCASFMSCDITTNQQGTDLSLTRHTSRGQHKKYVLHCQRHAPTQTEYLTPTQRKDRQIRHLKAALIHSTRACEEKDVEIERLKSEIDRLHLALTEVKFSDLHLDTVIEDEPNLEVIEEQSNINENCNRYSEDKNYLSSSSQNDDHCLEDSGILTDLSEYPNDNFSINKNVKGLNSENINSDMPIDNSLNSCKSPKPESLKTHNAEKISKAAFQKLLAFYNGIDGTHLPKTKNEMLSNEAEKRNISVRRSNSFTAKHISMFDGGENLLIDHQREMDEMKRLHSLEYQEMKEKYNDRVENLLQKLSDANARYMELRPAFDRAQDKIRQLELQLEEFKKEMAAQEEWHSQMYLKMYRKGQEAAKFEHADEVLEFAHTAPKRVSVPELLQQLHHTEHELERTKQLYRCELYKQAAKGNGDRHSEYTLKFLKDAMYYFLTEKDNKGHLKAIESILDFTDSERLAVSKALKTKNL